MQDLEEAIDNLHRRSWELYAVRRADPDARGRTPAQDVNEWLLTPASAARLSALRARAHAQADRGDVRGMRATLRETAPLLLQEAYMTNVLTIYWGMQEIVSRHAANLERLEARATEDDRAGRHARITALARALGDELPRVMASESLDAQTAALGRLNEAALHLIRAYNSERGELAVLVSGQDRALGKPRSVHPRERPCGRPVTTTSGVEQPRIGEGNAAPDAFYPPSSKRAWFEGSVMIEAQVSASGCVESAAVYDSSGVSELDEAAIRWTQQARFYPAARGHRAIAGTDRFRVTFRMAEGDSQQLLLQPAASGAGGS